MRAQLEATASLIDMVLDAAEDPGAEVELRGALEAVPLDCAHPKDDREPAPVAGHLDRFLCKACHQIVEGGA